jgi:hypothetical protein
VRSGATAVFEPTWLMPVAAGHRIAPLCNRLHHRGIEMSVRVTRLPAANTGSSLDRTDCPKRPFNSEAEIAPEARSMRPMTCIPGALNLPPTQMGVRRLSASGGRCRLVTSPSARTWQQEYRSCQTGRDRRSENDR